MEEILNTYKKIYKNILQYKKKEDLDILLRDLESFNDKISDNLLSKIEKFNKPYPLPLYYFSFIKIIKLALDLKKMLFQNKKFYLENYNYLRKKENRTEEENNLLNELGEILYRMDQLENKLNQYVYQLFLVIKSLYEENKIENMYLKKITQEEYSDIYTVYEKLMDTILDLIDELKLEKGLYKMCKILLEENNNKQ